MERDPEIRSLSRALAAHARWSPGSRAEKLARIASYDAQAGRHRREAERLEALVTATLTELATAGDE